MTTTPPRVARGAARGLRLLLSDAIDYAGLYPPAQLDMAGAVAEYGAYLQSSDAWALGRFVVPAGRVGELVSVLQSRSRLEAAGTSLRGGPPWRLSAVTGSDVAADVARLRLLNDPRDDAQARLVVVEAIEARASAPDAVGEVLRCVGGAFVCYVEVPVSSDPTPLIRAIAAGGGVAKVRTGGTSPEAFPSSDDLARFLAVCVREGVRFKATAGLHHPLRGEYALTYAPGSVRGTMFGFLNVFLATAFLLAGADDRVVRQVLDEREPGAVQFDEHGATWRGHRLTNDQLVASRELAITAFGSCSFREPIDDLSTLGML